MSSSLNLEITHLTESQSSKHVTVNGAIDDLDGAMAGRLAVTVAATNPLVISPTSDALHHLVLDLSGSPSGARNIVVPDNRKFYLVRNNTGQTCTVKTSAGTGVALSTSATFYTLVFCDGTNVILPNAAASVGAFSIDDASDVTITSSAAGQMLRRNSGNTAYVNEDVPYDVGTGVNGVPTVSATIIRYIFPRSVTFPASLTGSIAKCGTAPSAQTDFDIRRDGSSIGTMRFAASGTTASYVGVSATTFSTGQILTVVNPSNLNSLADLTFTYAGKRD